MIRAPRGKTLSARSWLTEAPLRMLMNNLDPDVAERPGDLVVYGGIGRAARNWECFDAIVAALRRLGDDETLLVQSGKPVGVFRTHADAPRVLIANSNLVPHWDLGALQRARPPRADDVRPDDRGLVDLHRLPGIVQGTYETFVEMGRRHFGGTLAGRWILTAARRHGRRAAARRHHGRCFDAGDRVPPVAHRQAPGHGYLDRQAASLDEAFAMIGHRGHPQGSGIHRPVRERGRAAAGNAQARRQSRRRDRPDFGPRSGPWLPAGALEVAQWEALQRPIRRASPRLPANRWPCTCAPCWSSSASGYRPLITATTSARWRSARA